MRYLQLQNYLTDEDRAAAHFTKERQIISITIRLDEGYQWGSGWTHESAVAFRYRIDQLARLLGCSITKPSSFISADELSDMGMNLYCHPMELTGYCWNFEASKIVDSCIEAGLTVKEVKVSVEELKTEAEIVIDYFLDPSIILDKFNHELNCLNKRLYSALDQHEIPESLYHRLVHEVWNNVITLSQENNSGGWSSGSPQAIAIEAIIHRYVVDTLKMDIVKSSC